MRKCIEHGLSFFFFKDYVFLPDKYHKTNPYASQKLYLGKQTLSMKHMTQECYVIPILQRNGWYLC